VTEAAGAPGSGESAHRTHCEDDRRPISRQPRNLTLPKAGGLRSPDRQAQIAGCAPGATQALVHRATQGPRAHVSEFHPGQEVRVKVGPMAGFLGVVLGLRGELRYQIEVSSTS
jgi:transcription antitermination factor NusG